MQLRQLQRIVAAAQIGPSYSPGGVNVHPHDSLSPRKRYIDRFCRFSGMTVGGTGLCSYRVRGVDGSCAEHSTVESYTVCQQSYLLLFGVHPLTLSLQA